MCNQFTCFYTGCVDCICNDGEVLFYQDCDNCIKNTGECVDCLFYDTELKFCVLHERKIYE